jgi:hypothetical protein
MSISKSRKTGTFDRTSVPGGFDEVTPAGASQVDTDEMNASLKQEQADRQAEESGENEGMLVHPD